MGRPLFLGYLFLVHLILLLFVMNPNFSTWFRSDDEPEMGTAEENFPFRYYISSLKRHLAAEDTLTPGSVMFIGDSQVEAVEASAITFPAVSYGIAGDTLQGLLFRYPLYRASLTAPVVVVSAGVNDLRTRSLSNIIYDYRRLVKAISSKSAVVCVGLTPVDESVLKSSRVTNLKINQLNREIERACLQARPDSLYVDVADKLVDSKGNLHRQHHRGDGLHLGTTGKFIFTRGISKAVSEIQFSRRAFANPNIAFRVKSKLPPCDPTPRCR